MMFHHQTLPVLPTIAQMAVLNGQHLRLVDGMRRLAAEAQDSPNAALQAFGARMAERLEAALK